MRWKTNLPWKLIYCDIWLDIWFRSTNESQIKTDYFLHAFTSLKITFPANLFINNKECFKIKKIYLDFLNVALVFQCFYGHYY